MSRPPDDKRLEQLWNSIAQYLIKYGFTGLSLRPLAKALGCTPRVLLYHFGSKEKMVTEILAQIRERQRAAYARVAGASFEEACQTIWKRISAPDSEPLFRLFFENYGIALRHPRLYRAFLHDTIEDWLQLMTDALAYPPHQCKQARAFATIVLAGLRGSKLNSRECLATRSMLFVLLVLAVLITPLPSSSQLVPGSIDVQWNEGSPNCAKNLQPPLQVHPYNSQTFILRENPCSTFEAPFLYLLVGSTKAVLIDTGDIADPKAMPLADTVMHLLPGSGPKIPLLVVHTHRHLDHRAGDAQFAQFPNAQVVGFDLDSVRRYYKFADWPNGVSEISLGDRTVDVIPTPGHNETEVSFYDRNTGLFFSGDFLMPARLLIDDASADLASAERVAGFVKDRQITFVLGGHIEMNSTGELFPWESQYHPHEHVLQMTKNDLLALPAAVRGFNGFYTVHGKFTMENSIRILKVLAVLVLAVTVALVWLFVRYFRHRKLAQSAGQIGT